MLREGQCNRISHRYTPRLNGLLRDAGGFVIIMALGGEPLSLAFASEALEHPDDAVVADPLEDETHAVAALAELVL